MVHLDGSPGWLTRMPCARTPQLHPSGRVGVDGDGLPRLGFVAGVAAAALPAAGKSGARRAAAASGWGAGEG